MSFILNSFYLLSILISSSAHGVNIQAYLHSNFTEPIWEFNWSEACHRIAKDKIIYAFSIRTDTCIIAYWDPDCKSRWSQKYMPGAKVLYYSDLQRIGSFQVCNKEEGGPQLDVDLTEFYSDAYVVPKVLASYRNVCSCVNVPQHVQKMEKWSINNYHNLLLVYYEPNCISKNHTSNRRFINAGHHWCSINVHLCTGTDSVTNTTYKYQSFGPDPYFNYFQTSCNSSVITTTATETLESTTENKMSVDVVFDKRFQVLTNQIMKLQTQVEWSNQNQSSFHKVILQQQTDYFTNFTQTVMELKENFRDFIEKIKSDLHDLFA